MDWEDLRVFLGVAEAGSLAAAARRLRVSHATVWRRIQSLERALGADLFERHPAGYALTAAGARFLRSLDGVQRRIDAARRRLDGASEVVEGEVRVAAPEFAGLILVAALPELVNAHPQVSLELLTGSPAAGLVARDVDIALRVERPTGGGFALEGAFAIPCGVYASVDYLRRFGRPKALDDFDGHRLIAFDHSMAHIAPKPWQRSGGKGATVVFRSNSPHARLAAVHAGLGLAMLPEPLARGVEGLHRAFSSDIVGHLDLIMLTSIELRREPRVVAVRDFLAAIFAPYGKPMARADG
jgi:molybdate transport repressor ModE-like protein